MDIGDVLDRLPDGAGAIGLLSSDEFTRATADFDRALLDATRAKRVALLCCAGHEHTGATLAEARRQLGRLGTNVDVIAHEPGDPTEDTALPDADLVYIPGGDPRALLRCMRGSRVWEHILKRWREGTAIAGSSAGAMALSSSCLVAGPGKDKPTEWSDGLGPLKNFGIAVHVATRPARWLHDVAKISRLPVLALEDATGVLVRAGHDPVVIGPGRVWIEPAGGTTTQ